MKKLFLLFSFILFLIGCEDSQKITPYFKPKKEFKFNMSVSDLISEINFLFVIDTSGSMSSFNKHLSDNIQLFLNPILTNYPHYNYNFAITTMTPSQKFNFASQRPLYLNFPFSRTCKVDPSVISRSSNIGHYLSYSPKLFRKVSRQQLICSLALNIQSAEGFDGGDESFFQSIQYITEQADSQFKTRFFGKNKFLILFFISDAYEGVDYDKLKKNQISNSADVIANKNFDGLKALMGMGENIRSYAVILSEEEKDTCGEGSGGDHYPFHVYSFIERTKGLRLSICDNSWGNQLANVSDDLLESLPTRALYLKDIPRIGTIEVFFNKKRVPKDLDKGWFLDIEKPIINFGPEFDASYYRSDTKSDDEVVVKYQPVNLNILQKSE